MGIVDLSTVPCVYLTNVLNEVLYGLPVGCELVLETTRDQLLGLFEKLTLACRQGGLEYGALSVDETKCLLKCSKLCLEKIDEDEFGTRLGESVEAADAVNQKLVRCLAAGGPGLDSETGD
jgi:hypothetical protein